VGGEIFRTSPGRPWGPPSLLYNGYRVFPGGKVRPRRDADPSPPSSAEVKKLSRAIPLLSLRAFVACERVKPTYSFLLEVESTPGPYWDRQNYVNEKFQ